MELVVEPGQEPNIKPVSEWNSRDVLLYFAYKWYEFRGQTFLIPNKAWVGFMQRINTFKRKTKISYEEYKELIDAVMSPMFTLPNAIPEFGCIVSEKVLWVFRQRKNVTSTDFAKLKQELYSDNLLWSKI